MARFEPHIVIVSAVLASESEKKSLGREKKCVCVCVCVRERERERERERGLVIFMSLFFAVTCTTCS